LNVARRLTIERRFRGPPDSVNGGYACGVTAGALGRHQVEATLLRPPPVERQLTIDVDDDVARLLDGEDVVAVARPSGAPIETPPPVTFGDAVAAAERLDVDAYRSEHEFPGCFVCGPDRQEGDGLRILSAPSDRPGMRVWPWIPEAGSFDDGVIDARLVWAVLDCPGGLAVMLSDDDVGPAVLGRLTARMHRRPERGERLVVAGWRGDRDGRKVQAGSAIWSESGDVIAAGRATWIELTDDQRRAFGGRSSPR
jgi:hypothetical protein